MQQESVQRSPRSMQYRLVTAALGILFIAIAALILATSEPATRIGAMIAAVIVGGLGIDAVVGAVRNRRSLVSRIGPLP